MAYNYMDKAAILYVLTRIKTFLDLKEDSVAGKGLSANDFTNELKSKLDGIAEGATNVLIDTVLSSTSENPVQNKAIYKELEKKAMIASPVFTGTPKAPTPTEGTNDEQIATTAFVSAAITTALAGVTGISFEKVDSLPAVGQTGVIYLVAKVGSINDIYDEYYWFNGAFEYMGTTAVDLSGYVKSSEMVAITSEEIDAMFADW